MVITTTTRKNATGDELSGITGQKHADLFITKLDEKGKWQKSRYNVQESIEKRRGYRSGNRRAEQGRKGGGRALSL